MPPASSPYPSLYPPAAASSPSTTSNKRSASRASLVGETSASKKEKKLKGKWSEEEEKLLIKLRSSGMKWVDISQQNPGRSATACRLRYQNYTEKKDWAEDEKDMLARLYHRFIEDMWKRIADEMCRPWRSCERMHWQLGEEEMLRRANVPFRGTGGSTAATATPTLESMSPSGDDDEQAYGASISPHIAIRVATTPRTPTSTRTCTNATTITTTPPPARTLASPALPPHQYRPHSRSAFSSTPQPPSYHPLHAYSLTQHQRTSASTTPIGTPAHTPSMTPLSLGRPTTPQSQSERPPSVGAPPTGTTPRAMVPVTHATHARGGLASPFAAAASTRRVEVSSPGSSPRRAGFVADMESLGAAIKREETDAGDQARGGRGGSDE